MTTPSPKVESPPAIEAVGVFLATHDVPRLLAWYRALGVPLGEEGYGAIGGEDAGSGSVFSIMPAATTLVENTGSLEEEPYGVRRATLNFRVRGLSKILETLRSQGTPVAGPRDYGYGIFAWAHDPDGNVVELWEPGAVPLPA